jgi:hypothetical protein
MKKITKKIFALALLALVFSCKSDKDLNSLVIPPNFSEMPDANNPEKQTPESQEESAQRLKELLLQAD